MRACALLIAAASLATGCHHVPLPDQFPSMHPRPSVPGIKSSDLPERNSPGAKTFAKYCDQCHNLPNPAMHTAAEWERIVPRMIGRMEGGMGHMGMMMHARAPSDAEAETLLGYLRDHAQQPLDPATLGAKLDTEAGRLFKETCSRCHALPSPKQHKSAEWPAVVERMTQNMRTMGKSVPTASQLDQIIGFLKENSAN